VNSGEVIFWIFLGIIALCLWHDVGPRTRR
jgi:hypothetical protein